MAKRRYKRRRRGTGSVIRVRKLSGSGVGRITDPKSLAGTVVPIALGGIGAGMMSVGVRQMIEVPDTEAKRWAVEYAPVIGIAGTAILSAAVYGIVGAPAAAMTFSAGTAVGLVMLANEMSAKAAMASANGAENAMGAIVPVYSRPQGMGAIVMEPQASRGYGAGALGGGRGVGSYGEVVNLGNINAKAFGTPGFKMAGA